MSQSLLFDDANEVVDQIVEPIEPARDLTSSVIEVFADSSVEDGGEPEEFALFGRDLFGSAIAPDVSGPLARRFVMPPFSVLNARDGAWQARKRAWLALGIESELGRVG